MENLSLSFPFSKRASFGWQKTFEKEKWIIYPDLKEVALLYQNEKLHEKQTIVYQTFNISQNLLEGNHQLLIQDW